MLIETALILGALRSACDVTLAAMGICGSQCDESEIPNGSFSLCASKEEKKTTATPVTKPMRECKYYVNGTIDIPTQTIITAWVEVGSRLCIGDDPPKKVVFKTVTEQLDDIFSAKAQAPQAMREGEGSVEPFQAIRFRVESETQQHSGSLFGEPAKIRFRPVSHRWDFSDGDDGYGTSITKAFGSEGAHYAKARVKFEVDYQTGGDWTYSAAEFWLSSNAVWVRVTDPPRKTLLVNFEG